MNIQTKADLVRAIREGGGSHYVYVLRYPDGVLLHGGSGTPFYVGLGRGDRLFSHEKQAREIGGDSAKLSAIRAIWASGCEVVRTIDSVHTSEPWAREQELMAAIGFLATGTGTLTNAQMYAPSAIVGDVDLRKYAGDQSVSDGNDVPDGFKVRNIALTIGPNIPTRATTVFGKIYAVVQKNDGVTGERLITILKAVDFSANKSAYTQSGAVSAAWLAGYIDGAVYHPRAKYLQPVLVAGQH